MVATFVLLHPSECDQKMVIDSVTSHYIDSPLSSNEWLVESGLSVRGRNISQKTNGLTSDDAFSNNNSLFFFNKVSTHL